MNGCLQLPFRCAHIAGTNGKGSTALYLGSIIKESGLKCGVYTSPHVVSPAERICINGECIPEKELDLLLKNAYAAGAPAFFHAFTAAAFQWFKINKIDWAVIETGLGGRFDPTNVILPEICVITRIGVDHKEVLGRSLDKIAYEKCGIIKSGVKVVTCAQKKDAMNVIEQQCRQNKSELYTVDKFQIMVNSRTIDGQSFDFCYDGGIIKDLYIRQLGLPQPQNACLAALSALKCGFTENDVRTGLNKTEIDSRFEYAEGNPPVIFDGAHNIDSALELKNTLKYYFGDKKTVVLCAVMKDKDVQGIVKTFSEFAGTAITVKADEMRGEDPKKLSEHFIERGVASVSENSIKEAYKKAIQIAKDEKTLLVICGSFYLVGKIKAILS